MLKESDDIDILGATFDSKMTFEKHIRSIFRAASQNFGILRKSWRVFHDRSLHWRCFQAFVLQFWSTALQCGARLAIHILNYFIVLSVVPVLQGAMAHCSSSICGSTVYSV